MYTVEYIYCDDRKLLQIANSDTCLMLHINIERGFTIEKWAVGGVDYIDCDLARAKNGATYGVPILYPTPNRIKNDKFVYEGEEFNATMHGALRYHNFEPVEVDVRADGVSVTAKASYDKDSKLYVDFPFASVFSVTLRITESSLHWEFSVENTGEQSVPYSLALHPFFCKHGESFISTNASSVMEMTDEKYPTGNMCELETLGITSGEKMSVEQQELDHVFSMQLPPIATIHYPEIGKKINLTASNEFGKMVIYTPKNKGWFCVENQTSSTDCHNMHNNGYVAEANLQIVAVGETAKSYIKYTVV